ncbi:GPI mannosyltransferase 4 [Euwallacea similis]|uniref:GPI mannosyltransferase 4 n=1 Tax=Euwallacea similis TaxID=1736056 RepID=UPI00344EEA7C
MSRRRKSQHSSNIIYYCLGALRVLLVLVPQNGYIHPDEYFQSVEVLAGRIFDVEHSPPWEFNATQPIRGMALPYFTTGLSYIFLRDINRLAIEYLPLNVVSPYFLLVLPRLIIALFSFSIDFCLRQICLNNNEKCRSRLIVLGSSYVILTYGTRTFSNSWELVLFAILLYFVCESQTFSNELVRKREYIKYRYDKSISIVEKVKFHKLKLYLVSDNYRNCIYIASLTVFGIFNRPTFIGYAVMPVFFWIYRGGVGEKRELSVLQFHTRILFFIFCSLPAVVFNIIIDSFYYGYITWGEIGMLDLSINNFVITPLNFLRYNFDSSNLERHGLHPRWLHLLVNIPLLFNVLGWVAFFTLGKYFYWCFRRKLQLLPSIKSIKMLMTMSFISPILVLSIFPHQEPRFLVPILFPLIYLHSEKILPEVEVKIPDAAIQDKRKEVKKRSRSNKLLKLWLFINAVLTVFYGFVHQGGVFPAVQYLHKDLSFSPRGGEFHIVTSGIYSLPQSFFLQKLSLYSYNNDKVKYSSQRRVFLHEEGSSDLANALMRLQPRLQPGNFAKIYLLISSSRKERAQRAVKDSGMSMLKLDSFWPHLSAEALPDFTKYCFNPTFIFYKNCQVLHFWEYLDKVGEMCRLDVYELGIVPVAATANI